MNCSEENCLCPEACSILSECVMGHPIVEKYSEGFRLLLLETVTYKRIKMVRRVFEALKPYKVSQYKIDRYWGLWKYDGIDLDKDNAPEKALKRQAKHKDGAIKKKTKAIIEMLTTGVWEQSKLDKIEENYRNKRKRVLPVKEQISILNGYEPKPPKKKKLKRVVKELGFYDNPIKMSNDFNAEMERQMKIRKEMENPDHADFIRNQTPEQFQLARKFGWQFAKMITDPPTQNFNYE